MKAIYNHILVPMYRGMVWLMKKIYEYVLKPLYKCMVWIAKAIYNHFLKYVIRIIQMQYFFLSKQLKIVYSWVFSDANGVVNYFITIPLIVIAIVGVIIYKFFIV